MNLNDKLKESQNIEKNFKIIKNEENNSNKIVLEDLNKRIKCNIFPPSQNNLNINNINKEGKDKLNEAIKNKNILKDKDKEIEQLQIIYQNELDELNKLKKELSNLKQVANNNNNSNKMSPKDIKRKLLSLENKYSELLKDKSEKEKELSNLLIKMKKSSDILNQTSIKLEEINSENFSLKNLNNKLKEKKKEKNEKKNELKLRMNKYIEIEITNSTENNFDSKNYDNNVLDEELLYQKINDLKMKINEIEHFKNIYEDKKIDSKITKKLLNEYISKNKINKKIIEDNEEKLNNVVDIINNNINEIIEWIIYSFGELNECNEGKLNMNINGEIIKNIEEQKEKENDKYKPSLLYKCLIEKDEKIKNKYGLLKKRNESLESEYKEIYSKYIELQKINDEYEESIENSLKEKNKLIDELNTLNNFVNNLNEEDYTNEKKILENENPSIDEKKEKEYISQLKQEIEDLNKKYYSMVNEKDELEKKLNDIKEKELIKDKEKINQKNKDIIIIKNELNQKHNKNKKDFKNCDKKLNMYADQNAILKNNKILLNKKIQSLLNEINLKKKKKKKQEEIKNYENEKNNYFFNSNPNMDVNRDNYYSNRKIIEDLELKRENLLYDNKLLIKENQDLKDKLNNFF